MIQYGIAILKLVEKLCYTFPDIIQSYAVDSGLFWCHRCNAWCLKLLMQLGLWFGYYVEATKSWHISTDAVGTITSKAFVLKRLEIKFAQGKWYIGSFISSADSWAAWIKEKVDIWVCGMRMLVAVAKNYLQTASCLACNLQGEWQYLFHKPHSGKRIGARRKSNHQ